jgi:23S rRNA pseudouridine1911/1915/1917 synthase
LSDIAFEPTPALRSDKPRSTPALDIVAMPALSKTMGAEPILLEANADFLVAAKPPHLLSHPTRPDGAPTLLGWLQARFPGEFLALANRLDRETSGVILVARSPGVASELGRMTMRREIEKFYLALVTGQCAAEYGFIDAPLGRLGLSDDNPIWLRRGVIPPGDPRPSAAAQTEFRLLGTGEEMSLLRLHALTGRLHQLRVHLAHIGHPVIGDKIYGPDPHLYLKFIGEGWTEEHAAKLILRRHALHAHELRFWWRGVEQRFVAPLPEDLGVLVENAGFKPAGRHPSSFA